MRGGFTDPWPTPRIPPKPPCLSCASVQTLQVSPTVFAIAWASLAIAAGGRSPAGVFTRSRAQQTASATISPARAAREIAFASHRLETRTVARASFGSLPGFL